MFKRVLGGFFIAVAFCICAAQTEDIRGAIMLPITRSVGVSTSSTQGINMNIDLKDSTSYGIVDKINEYGLQSNMLATFEDVRNHFDDRVSFEIHLGRAVIYDLDSGSAGNGFTLGLKYNIFQPKIVHPKRLLGKIEKARYQLAIRKFSFTDDMYRKCDQMESDVKTYMKRAWWKRLSVGVLFPFGITDSTGSYSYRNNYPKYHFRRMSGVVGYDITDALTVQVGATGNGDPCADLSIDISTPVLAFASNFYRMVAELLQIPRASVGYY